MNLEIIYTGIFGLAFFILFLTQMKNRPIEALIAFIFFGIFIIVMTKFPEITHFKSVTKVNKDGFINTIDTKNQKQLEENRHQ